MALRMEADSKPVVTDLVLVGGGHAHVHVLRMLGMQPMPGVRLTLITRDVETPILGHAPGPRRRRLLATRGAHRFEQARHVARARLIAGEVTHIDSDHNCSISRTAAHLCHMMYCQ